MVSIKLPTGTFEYDPTKPLGRRGGFGEVFAGRSPNGDEIAVKKLHVSAADAAHRELRIADELRGRSFEHVVPFIDSGEDADTGDYFVVMPRANESLQRVVDRKGKLAPAEAAAILLQISKGLIEVGELVHRDLKPDNVLLHEGKWKIADFGIARFVEEATASNTLKDYLSEWYAAPEQWRFERATHPTDIYAFGCIGFCLLTGMPPFTNDPSSEHQHASVPPFDCSEPRLTTLVNMCLRKLADSRPSLSRVRDLLANIVAKPMQTSNLGSLGALASAAAHVSADEQQAQARQEAVKAARIARTALARSAHEILADNTERLWGKIHLQAPNAKRRTIGRGIAFECELGNGHLAIDLSNTNCLDVGAFPESGWDVVAFSTIMVKQSQPQYCWSASLWFANIKGATDYRWYEASYWSWSGREFEPHCEKPGRDADLAASNVMHSVSLAFGPVAIDDEHEDEFHERWIWLLSKAAVGQLRRPSQMPFSWPFA